MKTINVSQAEGPVLDWLVAKCKDVVLLDPHNNKWELCWTLLGDNSGDYYSPTTNWSQGGPIIEREQITLLRCFAKWRAEKEDCEGDTAWAEDGPTMLVAAMRCFCVSKLGTTVEVPEELS